jgi:hypothetical protein
MLAAIVITLAWVKLPALQLAESLTRTMPSVFGVAAGVMLLAAWRAGPARVQAVWAVSAVLVAAAAWMLPSWRTSPAASSVPLATCVLCLALLPMLIAPVGAALRLPSRAL